MGESHSDLCTLALALSLPDKQALKAGAIARSLRISLQRH